MFELDLTKFSILGSNYEDMKKLRKSSNLPRPRLSRKNVRIHSDGLLLVHKKNGDHSAAPICINVEGASSSSSDSAEEDIPDFDYDYASISDCDSGHQSGCGSVQTVSFETKRNELVVPTSSTKSARFRSVSFTEEEDEDGYSYVSYNSGPPNVNVVNSGGKIHNLEIIGSNKEIDGPFGPRKCVYLDQGRPLGGIEQFIAKNVLPYYSCNTTNSKLVEMREETKQIVLEMCGGGGEDEVIFCGDCEPSQTLINLLALNSKKDSSRPVIILGPFQSFSNLSAWAQVAHEVIKIPENISGSLDFQYLERVLKRLKSKKVFKSRLVIGSFSISSNVTGALNDEIAITTLLHKYSAYVVWDYDAAGPHVKIQINPKTGQEELDKLAKKDAIFITGHKFPGGAQTSNVLISKSSFLLSKTNRALEERKMNSMMPSTNGIAEIRLGLVLKVHCSTDLNTVIKPKEIDFTRQVLDAWITMPEILVLGTTQSARLPLVSFVIKHVETGYFLHHGFVATLLTDLFGIQSSTGCMSDSFHSQELLGIDAKLAKQYDQQLKPGFTTMFLSYATTQAEITFIIEAVKLCANQGWKLLPFYEMDRKTGIFRFSGRTELANTSNVTIKSFDIHSVNSVHLNCSGHDNGSKNATVNYRYEGCLRYAQNLIDSIEMITQHNEITHNDDILPYFRKESLRWFLTPFEALICIKHPYNVKKHFDFKKRTRCPIVPKQLKKYNNDNDNDWAIGSVANKTAVKNCKIKRTTTSRVKVSPPKEGQPPRLVVKSSSLQSLDVELDNTIVNDGGPFSRRKLKSQLNHNYFENS